MSNDMKRLITSMTQKEAKDRCTFKQIRESKFYQGEFYDSERLQTVMKMIALNKQTRKNSSNLESQNSKITNKLSKYSSKLGDTK